MGADSISSIVDDFSSLLDAVDSSAQQCVLSEYLKNPFLDDDVHALVLRTGMARQEVGPVLAVLRELGLLQSAGRRGHMLDAQMVVAAAASAVPAPAVDDDAGDRRGLPFAPLLDALSCGVALIDLEEAYFEANAVFRQLLDWPSDDGDIERLGERLQCDLHQIERAGQPVTRALEKGVEVEIRPGKMGPFSGLIAVVNVNDGAWEVSKMHVQMQEDLFAHLREEVAHPAAFLQSFLEKPKKSDLGQARAAIERINACLALYLLDDSSDEASLS